MSNSNGFADNCFHNLKRVDSIFRIKKVGELTMVNQRKLTDKSKKLAAQKQVSCFLDVYSIFDQGD